MATGLLGQSALAATTNTTVYTVPASTFAVFGISVCNRGATTVTIRISISAAATPTNAEYIEYDAQIGPNGVLERTGLMAGAAKQIVFYTSGSSVSVSVFGIETAQ
jgi:hypothetical protein